jgi:hypothetical protein
MAETFRDRGKAAWKISGLRGGPAHGREWVENGMAGLPPNQSYRDARDAGSEAQFRARMLQDK